MKTLGQPNAAYAGDRGEPDQDVRRLLAVAGSSASPDDYRRAVAALCGTRLLLPIVATGDESDAGSDPDRHAEMAAMMMTSAAGERGVLVFTGLDSLQALDAAARPVPCTLDDVAATAREAEASAIVVDVAGPQLLVIEGDLISELAQGRRLVETTDGWGWAFRESAGPAEK